MARSRALTMRPTFVMPARRRRSGRRYFARGRRRLGGLMSRGARVARDNKHTFAAVAAGLAIGLAQKYGWLEKIPRVPGLGRLGTLGLALWVLNRQGILKGQMVAHAATGVLSIAAYQMGSTGEIAGDDDDLSGDL